MSASAPAAPHRIVQLDALRGLAVLGIAWMNVLVFAMPLQAYYNPLAWGGQTQADMLAWAASFVFVEDKFRTLFAMLFGAGCVILLERGERPDWRAHYARMAVLFAIGVVHSVLLASNDILRAYAMAGLFLPLFFRLSAPALIACAVGLVTVHLAAGFIVAGGSLWDWWLGRGGTDALFLAERNFGADPDAVAAMLERGRETLAERIPRRLDRFGPQLWVLAGSVPLNLAAITLGMALWRNRLLAGQWRTFRLQRLAAICAVASLPPLFGLAWWMADSGFPGALVGPVSLIVSAPFDMLLGVAYAAVAMALLESDGAATRRLAAAGRMSMTNYVLTSVIFGALYAGWGLGLFGEVSRVEAIASVLVPLAAILIVSPLWLARFRRGPLEWVWRRAARALA